MKISTELVSSGSTEAKTPASALATINHSNAYRLANLHNSSTVRPSRLVNMGIHNSDLESDTSSTPAVAQPISSGSLEVDIAADYTVASIDAAKASLPTDDQNELSLAIRQYRGASSIDEVAKTAAEAIASIRNATDPGDIAKQITALKKFSDQIKKDSSIPEMQGLSDTLEKFITVVTKSTGIKLIQEEATPVKVTPKPVSKPTASVTAKKVVVGRNVSRPATKPVTKPINSVKTTKALRSTRRELPPYDDVALRKALRSVATMNDDPKVQTKTKTSTARSSAKATTRKAKSYSRVSHRGTGKRIILAIGCAAACVTAIIYCISTNIPDLSVRVAAMQTGVEASYPSYIPRDFSLEGINSENGKITLSFVGPDNAKFTLIEEKSSWDSTALLRNYIEPTWHENYTTTHEQGITIYINGSNAAWVNGGVLYKINSTNNTLTKKQLRNIVTSM